MVSYDPKWKKVREDYLKKVKFNSGIPAGALVGVEVAEGPKVYGIRGPYGLKLRGELPRNYNHGSHRYQGTMYNRKWGMMYMKNEVNLKALKQFQACVNYINDLYKGRRVGKDIAPLDKTFGIVGWDVPCEEPDWLLAITGSKWDRKLNPAVTARGVWTFGKCAISAKAAEKAMAHLVKQSKNGRKVWESLFAEYIYFKPGGACWSSSIETSLKKFLKDDAKRVAWLGWGRHARCCYKDPVKNLITVIDPWKQNQQKTKAFKDIGRTIHTLSDGRYSMSFMNRTADQGSEGSCTAIALMRAIMMAEYGLSGATRPVDCTDAILTSRLISKFRRFAQ